MEAGRELDKLIAEKVMGNHIEIVHGILMERNPQLAAELAYYSTNIADAWQVVEKIRLNEGKESSWYFVLRDQAAPDQWEANFIYRGDKIVEYKESADTASLAICLAALKAFGAATPA